MQITGHFILYEAFQVSTGKLIGEFVIDRDEPDHEKTLKRELRIIAKEAGIRISDLQSRALGKH
jgi:hypothetical protein